MKKWTFTVITISILSILITGCTSVGAINFPVNTNDKGKQIEDTPPHSEGEGKVLDQENISKSKENDLNDKKYDNNKLNDGANSYETEEEKNYEKDRSNKNIESKIHYSLDTDKKQVALTFDDGPESKYTPQILEILDKYDIKATFFVIGQNAEKYPETLKQIYELGHEIGNHSWSHKYIPNISEDEIEKELLMTEKVLVEILGETSYIFRPAYGAIKSRGLEYVNSLGYHVVNWSVDTRDWAGTSSAQMMNYVKSQLTPGGIILMHNTSNSQNTTEFLPEAIEWIIDQGYEFLTVSEILDF